MVNVEVLVVLGGFVCTYFLCMLTLSDWENHPFVTNVETRPITEVQFPTVTVCRDPQQEPDRWALASRYAFNLTCFFGNNKCGIERPQIRAIANNAKFECYGKSGYPHCSEETENTRFGLLIFTLNFHDLRKCAKNFFRNHLAVKEMLDVAVRGIVDKIDNWPSDTMFNVFLR